jgi:hypothetical protein
MMIALEQLAARQTANGEIEKAILTAQRWLALDPLNETGQRQLMRLHALAGNRAARMGGGTVRAGGTASGDAGRGAERGGQADRSGAGAPDDSSGRGGSSARMTTS